MRWFCTGALVLLGLANANAAQPADGWVFSRWSVDDGLPLDHVNALAQTPDGFLWIATFDGLVRFDGHDFTVFHSAALSELPSDRIVDLHADDDGDLWIITENGMVTRLRDGVATLFPLSTDARGFVVLDGTLMAESDPGLLVWQDDVPTLLLPEAPDVRALAQGADGTLWVGSGSGVFRLTDGTAAPLEIPPLTGLYSLWVDAQGVLWGGHAGGITPLSPAGETLPFAEEGHDRVCSTVVGADGRLRVQSDWGWGILDGGAIQPEHRYSETICASHRRTSARQGDHLWRLGEGAVLRDGAPVLHLDAAPVALEVAPDGAVWVGTIGDGLYRVRPALIDTIDSADGLPSDNTRALAAGADAVVVLPAVRSRLSEVSGDRVTTRALPAYDATSVLVDAQGQAWVGLNQTLCRLTPDDCELLPSPGLDRFSPTALLEHDGGILAAAERGLFFWDGARWAQLSEASDDDMPQSLAALPDGTVLVGTRGGGLLELGQDGGLSLQNALAADRIRGITVDGDVAWLGTEGTGLCRLPLSGGPPACLGTAEGLPADTVHTVQPDAQGRLWASTNVGLAVLSRAEVEATLDGAQATVLPLVLTEQDGMTDREGNGTHQPSSVRYGTQLWFATQGGVAIASPDDFPVPAAPRAQLTALSVGDAPHAPNAPLSLTEEQRDITVAWTAPEFSWPEQVRFQHRLVGYRDGWSAPSAQRQASWTNLPPGDLRVEVRAGLGGQWGPPATLSLRRAPAFSETIWMPLGIGVLSVLLLGSGGYARVLQLKRRQRELEAVIAARTAELAQKNQRLTRQADQLSFQNDSLEQQNRQIREQSARLTAQNSQIRDQAERLRAQDTIKTRFVANISHELRTPVSLIAGPLADTLASDALPDRERARLARSLRNAERLQELIEQILDVARLDEDGIPLKARRMDLGRFLRRVSDRFTEQAARAGLALSVLTPPEPVWGYTDPDLLDKVLTNLLGNALKFTDQGSITVSLTADDARARVAVRDTGVGIPEPARRRLFERFFQADSTETRRHEGAGIGLSLAAELVALHGGRIDVESAPGQGSTFWFTLPLGAYHLRPEEIDLSTDAASLPEAPPTADGERPRVLLAEDHPDMRAYLSEHLGRSFSVQAVSDGAAVLDAARERRPAAIVSDVSMPVMDGLTMCRSLRADPALSDIPVLLLSARASTDDRVAGLAVANDYLTKPFQIRELLARVQRLVQAAPDAPESAPEPAPEPARPEVEQRFLDKLDEAIGAHRREQGFGVAQLAKRVAVSDRQLRREVKRLTGMSATAYLREARLQHARALLQRGSYATVSEVAAEVGMSPGYFSRAYNTWAGHPPSQDLHA